MKLKDRKWFALRVGLLCLLLAIPAHAAPAVSAKQDPEPWFSLYSRAGAAYLPTGSGSLSIADISGSADLKHPLLGGAYVAGAVVLARIFHLGGYLTYLWGESAKPSDSASGDAEHSQNLFSIGPFFKIGETLSDRVWIGFHMDLGYVRWSMDDTTYSGFLINPGLGVDVMLTNSPGFKMGLFALFSGFIIPKASTTIQSIQINVNYVAPMFQLGVILGT